MEGEGKHGEDVEGDNTHGKVWLITGCSSGLGRALAEAAAAAGHRVVATARQTAALDTLKAPYGDSVHTTELDVTRPEQIRDAVEDAVGVFGRLDVVVNNAGYGLLGALEELSDAQIERNLSTNFFGPLRVMRAALPVLRAQGSGHIINIGAMAAVNAEMGFGVYGGSKAALDVLSDAVASEVSVLGIKVTVVIPGPFRTQFIGSSIERAAKPIAAYERTSGKFAAFLAKLDGSQPGDPAKAAQAILRIAAEDRPARRLYLGRFAYEKTRAKAQAMTRDLDAWPAAGLDTDFAG
jgi:NAD(P)-dependent dehydrogenase (short-subunit alcohol dehydrogenase family)